MISLCLSAALPVSASPASRLLVSAARLPPGRTRLVGRSPGRHARPPRGRARPGAPSRSPLRAPRRRRSPNAPRARGTGRSLGGGRRDHGLDALLRLRPVRQQDRAGPDPVSAFHFSPRPNRASEIEWRTWVDDAFREAKAADKPVLLAISAVWCHWCHVMDETSYSDADVIRGINERYIPIRVDTDQRPDVNRRY